jgi:uncharacterized membrane protein
MPVIRTSIDIPAPPQAVYDLIADVEKFPEVFKQIKSVHRTAEGSYVWEAILAGRRFNWEGRVCDSRPPGYFSWESIKGVHNKGRYSIEAITGGSRVDFVMEYQLPAVLSTLWLKPLVGLLVKGVVDSALVRIKAVLAAPPRETK